jgi:hypothetical protein
MIPPNIINKDQNNRCLRCQMKDSMIRQKEGRVGKGDDVKNPLAKMLSSITYEEKFRNIGNFSKIKIISKLEKRKSDICHRQCHVRCDSLNKNLIVTPRSADPNGRYVPVRITILTNYALLCIPAFS